MRCGAAFARQGSYPDAGTLARPLALLEQRAANKFAALDAIEGDVVGVWRQLDTPRFDFGSLGNGTLTGRWRAFGVQAVQMHLLLVVGSATSFPGNSFSPRLPPGYALDQAQLLDGLNGVLYGADVRISGAIGAGTSGFVGTVEYQRSTGRLLVVATALATLAAGDRVNFRFELPVKVAT